MIGSKINVNSQDRQKVGLQRQRSMRSIGLRRIAAWTRFVAHQQQPTAPSNANAPPQIRIEPNRISQDNRLSSTSAPVSCKEAYSSSNNLLIVVGLYVSLFVPNKYSSKPSVQIVQSTTPNKHKRH